MTQIDASQALIREIDAKTKLNAWMLARMEDPSLHAQVREVVRRSNLAHQGVLAALREWRGTGNSDVLVAACDAFVALVEHLTA